MGGNNKDLSRKTFHDICETYPVSAKFITIEKTSDSLDEHFEKFISIASSLPVNSNSLNITL